MKKYNWVKDKILHRYHQFKMAGKPVTLPPSADLRAVMPPIVDQLNIGSCTANAWAYLLGSLAIQADKAHISIPEQFFGSFHQLSRLFIYYNERAIQGTIYEDSGATLTAGMQAVQVYGVCPEEYWPYMDRLEFVQPFKSIYKIASFHRVPHGFTLDSSKVENLKSILHGGSPFVFGMSVYESFEKNVGSNGWVPMPNLSKEELLGGHALCCAGYDDSINGGAFLVANSWNTTWGNQGYCYIPYDYLTDPSLASDFWTLKI